MKEVVKITSERLVLSEVEEFIQLDEAGGQVYFVGTVRNQTKGKEVTELEFECYESMAINEVKKIINRAASQWPILAVSVHHRTGVLEIGEYPVIIGVSCRHRKEAFAACEYLIDKLKKSVPIWKKEKFVDGEVWVSAHP